jgi:hypothetical protein
MQQANLFVDMARDMENMSVLYLSHEASFDKFWAAYPKKRAKANAKKAWLKLPLTRTLFAEIMDSLNKFKRCDDWQKKNGQFIPLPASWINGKRWEDNIETMNNTSVCILDVCLKCNKCKQIRPEVRKIDGKHWCIDCYQKYGDMA